MKLLNIILLGSLSFSCATNKIKNNFQGLEKVTHNPALSFYLDSYQPKKMARKIASSPAVPELSNRQIYFLSLYQQYLTLAHTLENKETIKFCPSFHQVILEFETDLKNRRDSYSTQINFQSVRVNKDRISYYPVLSMAATDDQMLYEFLNKKGWQDQENALKQTLQHYHTGMEQEVQKLCETGVSPGYYVYENLVTYFKEYKDFHHTRAGLKALLKVPTLANMAVLDNLSQTSYYLSQENVFDQWLLDRAQTAWFRNYLGHIKQKRSQQLKTKLER